MSCANIGQYRRTICSTNTNLYNFAMLLALVIKLLTLHIVRKCEPQMRSHMECDVYLRLIVMFPFLFDLYETDHRITCSYPRHADYI